MSALICDICGGDIVMNSTGEFAVCESCGMKHSKERVQAKIQEIKGTVAVEGTVEVAGTVKVEGINDAEKLYENAKAFIKLGEFEKCKKVLEELVDKYPDDYRGWWGILELNTVNFTKYESSVDFIKYFNHAMSVVTDENVKGSLEEIYNDWYEKRYNHLCNSKLSHIHFLEDELFYKDGVENAQRCNKKIGVFKALGFSDDAKGGKGQNFYTLEQYTYRFDKFVFVNGCTAGIEYIGVNTEKRNFVKVVNFSNIINRNIDEYIDSLPDGEAKSEFASEGCYVATCVYGSYECPQVWTLRRFRDNTLAETAFGRAFIRTYYAISPILVKWFGNTYWFKKMWKRTLDKMVSKLQASGVEDTPYQDRIW